LNIPISTNNFSCRWF